MLCTCATTRAAMVVSKSKDSAPFSRPTIPFDRRPIGPSPELRQLGPVQSYASWASTTALGIFRWHWGFFHVLNSYQLARNSLWRQPTAAVPSWDHNFLLFFCGSRADPSCQDVTVTRSLSGRRRAFTEKATLPTCRWCYISGLSGSN